MIVKYGGRHPFGLFEYLLDNEFSNDFFSDNMLDIGSTSIEDFKESKKKCLEQQVKAYENQVQYLTQILAEAKKVLEDKKKELKDLDSS